MTGLWAFLAAAALLAVIAYLQIAYARANYPPSWGWRPALFAPLFLLFTLLGYFLASSGDNTPAFDVLFGVGMGLVGGLAYTFLLTRNRQRAQPGPNTRKYTDEEIDAFLESDRLDAEERSIADRFTSHNE